ILLAPGVPGPHDLGMLAAIVRMAMIQEKVPKHAPGCRDVEFGEQAQQAVDQGPLGRARLAEPFRAEKIEGAPNELDVNAERENAPLELPLETGDSILFSFLNRVNHGG